MKKNSPNKKVFVGLSGGVDSSVSAAILKKAGYDVVGVFIRTWQPDFIECTFREDRLDAMRVAAHLDIPFLECNAENEYKKAVAEYMIEEYKSGRTPNPDVMCNREIKFGVFWNFAKKHGADFIATGHYAQNDNGQLKKAIDPGKDQVYFLYRLTQLDLEHIIFPIGHLKKDEVRKLADKFGLPNARKKDSQGICMLGDLDLKKFLAHYIPEKKGEVLNEKGEVVGYHDGAIFLTLGERHGFTITQKGSNDDKYYVVQKDISKNTVTVSNKQADFFSAEKKSACILSKITWVNKIPKIGKTYEAQIRYHGEFLKCHIENLDSKNPTIIFNNPILVAKGQSIVLYEKNICLGGGVVE